MGLDPEDGDGWCPPAHTAIFHSIGAPSFGPGHCSLAHMAVLWGLMPADVGSLSLGLFADVAFTSKRLCLERHSLFHLQSSPVIDTSRIEFVILRIIE